MTDSLAPHYLELVADAALKSYWRHQALWRFLRRCGISESFLATWIKPESKREFLTRLFPKLESTDDGVRLINRMASALVQQTSFPDLEGWEDAELKKHAAKQAVVALREFMNKQHQAAQDKRDRELTRKRARELQEESKRREASLQKFTDRLTDLSRAVGTQRAGYDFQDWFYDLVDFFEVVSRRPYVTSGRQIDGSITADGTTYLVETKFTATQADATDIDTFHKKVTSKADNTMGVVVSISGYSSVAISEASGPKTPLLLLDHSHIYMMLNGTITLEELVNRVRRHSSQTGEAYLATKDFGG
jgi:hypothetical protein